ncbi:MAG: hypothetical protein QM820_24260 [Minicystis sp.]
MIRMLRRFALLGSWASLSLACAAALPGCAAEVADPEVAGETVQEAAQAVNGGQPLFVPGQMIPAEQTFVSAVNAAVASAGETDQGRTNLGNALFRARRRLVAVSGHTGIVAFNAGVALRLPIVRSTMLQNPAVLQVMPALWQKWTGTIVDPNLDALELHNWQEDVYDRMVDMMTLDLGVVMDGGMPPGQVADAIASWLDAVLDGYASAGDGFAPVLLWLLGGCGWMDDADAFFWAGSGDSNKNGVADGNEDWDNDGVINRKDRFPFDASASCVPPVIITNFPWIVGPGRLYTTADQTDAVNAYRAQAVSWINQDFSRLASAQAFATTMTVLTPTYSAPVRWVR